MSQRRSNIVLGGVGVRVRCKDEEVERTMVFHHFLQVSQELLATIVAQGVILKGSCFLASLDHIIMLKAP